MALFLRSARVSFGTFAAVLLCCGGCGGTSGPVNSRDQAVRRVASIMNSIAGAIDDVDDGPSAEAAAESIHAACQSISAIAERARELPEPSEQEVKALEESTATMTKAKERLKASVERMVKRVEGRPDLEDIRKEMALSISEFEVGLFEFAISLSPRDAEFLDRARESRAAPPPPAPNFGPRTPQFERPPEAHLTGPEREQAFLTRYGPPNTVILRMARVPNDRTAALVTHLKELSGATAHSQWSGSAGTVICLAPVADREALLAKLDFGAATLGEGRVIEIELDESKLP